MSSSKTHNTVILVLPPGTPNAAAVIQEAMRNGATFMPIVEANTMSKQLLQSFTALRPTIFLGLNSEIIRLLKRRHLVERLDGEWSAYTRGWSDCAEFLAAGARQKGVFHFGTHADVVAVDLARREA